MAAAIVIFVFTVPFLFVTPIEAMFVHGICSIIYIPIIVVWIRDFRKFKASNFKTYEQYWHYHHNMKNFGE